MKQRLDFNLFKTIVACTPLVSIDLIVLNSQSQVLLGLRNNKPAQGYWFVPGGRICKGETFDIAFKRLVNDELGIFYNISNAKFIGHYQHIYSDNFCGEDFSTHYITLGYLFRNDINITALPSEQHDNYEWWDIDMLLSSKDVHDNTKAYFLSKYFSDGKIL